MQADFNTNTYTIFWPLFYKNSKMIPSIKLEAIFLSFIVTVASLILKSDMFVYSTLVIKSGRFSFEFSLIKKYAAPD